MCHDKVRLWRNRVGPLFASDFRRQSISRMRGFRHWRWSLDEMHMKINSEIVCLWRAEDRGSGPIKLLANESISWFNGGARRCCHE